MQKRLLENARVLVVEDEPIIAFDIVDVLSAAGATVVGPVTTPGEARDLVRGEALNCAILDIRLGKETSDTVAEMLTARGVPFVFHTGDGDIERLKQAFPRSEVLVKPASPEQLLRILTVLCGA